MTFVEAVGVTNQAREPLLKIPACWFRAAQYKHELPSVSRGDNEAPLGQNTGTGASEGRVLLGLPRPAEDSMKGLKYKRSEYWEHTSSSPYRGHTVGSVAPAYGPGMQLLEAKKYKRTDHTEIRHS